MSVSPDRFPFKVLPDKVDSGQCMAAWCQKEAKRGVKCGLCHGHYQSYWRHNNPLMAYFQNVRARAKRRHIEFNLTFEDFKSALPENWRDLTIDRKREGEGYSPDNIQFITLSENVKKINRERYLPAYVRSLRERKRLQAEKEAKTEDPF